MRGVRYWSADITDFVSGEMLELGGIRAGASSLCMNRSLCGAIAEGLAMRSGL